MYYLLIIFLKNKIFPNKIYKFHLQRLKQTPFKWKKKRKPEIWDRRKSEDSRFVENACPAFLLAPTSHCIIYEISAFLLFGSRRKLIFRFEEEEGIIQKIMRVNQRKILHKTGKDKCNFYTIKWESIPFWRCSF